MIGIIDIGSNTIRLNVYDNKKLLFHSKEMAGLANLVKHEALSQEGIDKLLATLSHFKSILDNLNIQAAYPFATASLRLVNNFNEIKQTVYQELGFNIELISGEKEGRLGLIGALYGQTIDEACVIDIGGGSCEVVLSDNNQLSFSHSYPIGSLSLYKKYVQDILPTAKEIKVMQKYVKSLLKQATIPSKHSNHAVGIGGTNRCALAIFNQINQTQVDYFTYQNIQDLFELYQQDPNEVKKLILKIAPERIHTFIPGLLILKTVMKKLKLDKISISDNGVREGYLIAEVLKEGKYENQS